MSHLRRILLEPRAFFRAMPALGGLSGPLAFALITHWIGETLNFLWRNWVGSRLSDVLRSLFKVAEDVSAAGIGGRAEQLALARDRLFDWLWGVGPVLLDPVKTLLTLLFLSSLVYLGVRLLVTPGRNGAPRTLQFETALRIVCYGSTPGILAAVPLFGGVAAWIGTLVITVIGAQEVYRISGGRALVIALFPNLLFVGIILSTMAVAILSIVKLMASALGT